MVPTKFGPQLTLASPEGWRLSKHIPHVVLATPVHSKFDSQSRCSRPPQRNTHTKRHMPAVQHTAHRSLYICISAYRSHNIQICLLCPHNHQNRLATTTPCDSANLG
jgi:hypothetical protein